MIRYLETFFDEKDLRTEQWELTDEQGVTHFINSDVVLEQLELAPIEEQEAIANVLRRIDFANGDVNDFLKHLAGALING